MEQRKRCPDCTTTEPCPLDLERAYIAAYWQALQGGCFVTHGMLTNTRLYQRRVDRCKHRPAPAADLELDRIHESEPDVYPPTDPWLAAGW